MGVTPILWSCGLLAVMLSCKEDPQERYQVPGERAQQLGSDAVIEPPRESGSGDDSDRSGDRDSPPDSSDDFDSGRDGLDDRDDLLGRRGGSDRDRDDRSDDRDERPDRGGERDRDEHERDERERPRRPFPELDGAPGKFDPNVASSPDFFTQMPRMMAGKSPHGRVRIWYSDILKGLIDRTEFIAPVGSVAIKKFQNSGDEGYAVMIKRRPGYDRDNRDWYYEMRDLDGSLRIDPKPGRIEKCIKCHERALATDYLAGTRLVGEDSEEDGSRDGDEEDDPGQFPDRD